MSETKRKIGFIVGTRPELIKLAPIIQQLRKGNEALEAFVIATGQHRELLTQALASFNLESDENLDVMTENQSLAELSVAILARLPDVLTKNEIDGVVVQGDTTSAWIAALAASYIKLPVFHVEAGLRSYNRAHPFPEETNRVLIDQISSLLFAPTERNAENLRKEGISPDSIKVTGNTIVDAIHTVIDSKLPFADKQLEAFLDSSEEKKTLLLTTHRRENFGAPLENICRACLELLELNRDLQIVYVRHPNPNIADNEFITMLTHHPQVFTCEPQDYQQFILLLSKCDLALSDSGGIQEEAPSVGKRVFILRETTERPEGVEAGSSTLVGTDRDAIVDAVTAFLESPQESSVSISNPFGDGNAVAKIIDYLEQFYRT